jgi:small subunit ribosomal protein S4
MGDPIKSRRTYASPAHPWNKARIESEKTLVSEFGLKNKREIYKHIAQVRRFVDNFKRLNYQSSDQSELEKKQLLAKVKRLGLLSADKELTAVLDLQVKDIMARRLQTIVYKKHLARTIAQARQLIVHRHVLVNGVPVDSPGYLVSLDEESTISFMQRSPFISESHPERTVQTKEEKRKAGAKATAQSQGQPQETVAEVEVSTAAEE